MRRSSRRVFVGLAAALPVAAQAPASLIMFERHDCPWCRRWLREVGETSWNGSDLGQRAPLRRVDLAQPIPADLAWLRGWRVTPTFVLVVSHREVGRIIGYPGDLFFWQQAELLLARLD